MKGEREKNMGKESKKGEGGKERYQKRGTKREVPKERERKRG